MGFIRFYFTCLAKTLPIAWEPTWIFSAVACIVFAVIAVVFGFVGLVWKPFDITMNFLVGIIPLAIFAAIMIGGPLVTAYRMHKEQRLEYEKERSHLIYEINSLKTQLSSEPAIHTERRTELEKQWDNLNETERIIVKRIFICGGQTENQLRDYLGSLRIDLFIEGGLGVPVAHKTSFIDINPQGQFKIKDDLKSLIERLLAANPLKSN